MKIVYIVNARIPTEKAHGFQMSKMCEELSNMGAQVELWVPQRKNQITKDLFLYYDLKKNFTVKYILCIDVLKYANYLKALAFILQTRFFIRALHHIPLEKETIIISRNPEIISYYSQQRFKTIYDAHNFPERRIDSFLRKLKRVSGIICNSSGTSHEFITRGFSNVVVLPNGVDLRKFDITDDKQELRKKYALPIDKKIITYVGHLYTWKGVDVVLKAAELLKERSDIYFLLVGGTQSDLEKYREIIKKKACSTVILAGHRERSEVPLYLHASDILLLSNVATNQESIHYTSPIKMFEYMASGVPIIASDLPSLREILSEDSCSFFEAGNAYDLAQKIIQNINNPTRSDEKARYAKMYVKDFSWEERAKKMFNFIKSL